MPPLNQGSAPRVLKIEWKTSGIDHVCVCLAHSIQGSCKTQLAWHWQRLRSQRPQWVCEKKVALLWRLALEHIYLCTMACAGREPYTKASEEAVLHGVDKGRVSTQKRSKPLTWLRLFWVFSRWMQPSWPLAFLSPSLMVISDHRHSGKWNLLICEPQHCLFKWGLKKMRSAGQESREDWEGSVK